MKFLEAPWGIRIIMCILNKNKYRDFLCNFSKLFLNHLTMAVMYIICCLRLPTNTSWKTKSRITMLSIKKYFTIKALSLIYICSRSLMTYLIFFYSTIAFGTFVERKKMLGNDTCDRHIDLLTYYVILQAYQEQW